MVAVTGCRTTVISLSSSTKGIIHVSKNYFPSRHDGIRPCHCQPSIRQLPSKLPSEASIGCLGIAQSPPSLRFSPNPRSSLSPGRALSLYNRGSTSYCAWPASTWKLPIVAATSRRNIALQPGCGQSQRQRRVEIPLVGARRRGSFSVEQRVFQSPEPAPQNIETTC